MDKQIEFGRDFYEINAAAFRRLTEADAEAMRKNVASIQSFFAKLPEVKDFAGLTALQREYGETVWGDAQAALEARSEILREAGDRAAELVRGAFSPSTEPAPEAPKKTTSRAKAAA